MENNKLTTVYAENMNTACPFDDYPRPMMRRDSYLCLNGCWDFAYALAEPSEYKEKILVPFPPESQLSGIGRWHEDEEKLFYRRKFTLPCGFIKSRVLLHFGAVDQICEVFVNRVSVGTHEGGYIPFSFDVTELLKSGENEISVVATDTLSPDYPYGKQRKKRGGMWYTPVSGIWQTVWLESTPESAIQALKITQTAESVKIEVQSSAKEITLRLKDTDGLFTLKDGSVTLKPENPILWTPENPHLYYFTLETEDDRIESYFALREIGIKKIDGIPRLTLNGEPYLFHGLLDQGYFPDGIFLPATSEGFADDIKTAKALGFNMLRKHIKVEPQIFYHLCDKLGIVVFQDMVNNSDYSFMRDTVLPTLGFKRKSDKRLHKSKKSREIFKSTMKETLELLHNYPSVLYYTIFNEGWGQFSSDEVYEDAKSIDPTRIYDSTSGWFWQKKSDVDSHHVYFKKIKLRQSLDMPLVLSEFGGYSYRAEGHLFGDKNYGYKSFKSQPEFQAAVLDLYENEVMPLVKNGASALVYTQISDVEDETNGFLTYDRKVCKVDVEAFSNLSKKLKEQVK